MRFWNRYTFHFHPTLVWSCLVAGGGAGIESFTPTAHLSGHLFWQSPSRREQLVSLPAPSYQHQREHKWPYQTKLLQVKTNAVKLNQIYDQIKSDTVGNVTPNKPMRMKRDIDTRKRSQLPMLTGCATVRHYRHYAATTSRHIYVSRRGFSTTFFTRSRVPAEFMPCRTGQVRPSRASWGRGRDSRAANAAQLNVSLGAGERGDQISSRRSSRQLDKWGAVRRVRGGARVGSHISGPGGGSSRLPPIMARRQMSSRDRVRGGGLLSVCDAERWKAAGQKSARGNLKAGCMASDESSELCQNKSRGRIIDKSCAFVGYIGVVFSVQRKKGWKVVVPEKTSDIGTEVDL